MSDFEKDLVYRLAYRAGRLLGLGFPWFKKDIALHIEAVREINDLRCRLRDAEAEARRLSTSKEA